MLWGHAATIRVRGAEEAGGFQDLARLVLGALGRQGDSIRVLYSCCFALLVKATAGELLFLNPKKEKWRTQKGFIWRMIDSRYMYVDYAYEQSTYI